MLSNEYLLDIVYFCAHVYKIQTLCLVNNRFFQLVSPFLYEYGRRSIYRLWVEFDEVSVYKPAYPFALTDERKIENDELLCF